MKIGMVDSVKGAAGVEVVKGAAAETSVPPSTFSTSSTSATPSTSATRLISSVKLVSPDEAASQFGSSGPPPFGFVKHRFQSWFEARLSRMDSMVLTQRNVYILPTRAGWMLGLTLLVLLVASINYQLNLGYLLTFLLAGSALVGMHISHGTLRGTAMNLIAPPAQYVGTPATIDIKLTNTRRSTRYGIGLSVIRPMQGKSASRKPATERHWAWADVPPQGSSMVQVAFTPLQRGLHHLPTLTAETRFPLGTFRVWTVWRPAAQITVFPAPESRPPPLPPSEPQAGQAGSTVQRLNASGDYEGVRAYQRGDPMKLVIWKKAAKAQAAGSNDLVSRDTQQSQQQTLWLDAQATSMPDIEARLSRLCAWVLMADRLGLDYGLRLAGRSVGPSQGEAHKRACLEALALC